MGLRQCNHLHLQETPRNNRRGNEKSIYSIKSTNNVNIMFLTLAFRMQLIAKIAIRRHDIDELLGRTSKAHTQCGLYLYRVIGNSPKTAARLCERRTDEWIFLPSVAITFEDLSSVGKAQIAVCNAIKQKCRALQRNFYLCGVTPKNRGYLTDTGLFDGIDIQNIHTSVAALLQTLSSTSSLHQTGRKSHEISRGRSMLSTLLAGSGTLD